MPHPLTNTNADQIGAIERFFAAFFRPRNIRVMLLVGAGIVFASSLMLVTKSWGEWPAWLQYLTVVTYTGGIYLASLACRRHLQLPATARALASLTLLLLPILFHALAWVSPGTTLQWLAFSALALPSLAMLITVAPQILDDWMGQRQTTFIVCFVILSIAGCMPELTNPILAIVTVALFWTAFTAGALKTNRLAFWMSRSKQRVRGFAFTPIAILGTMFFTLLVTKVADVVPSGSMALAMVMTAGTFLGTSREFAAAVRQQTGDLIRPLPMEILVPLAIGLFLTAAAVILAMVGFAFVGPTTYSVIPTALLASAILAAVAWDLRDRVLAISAVICWVIAYQCSPVLFADLVHWIRDSAAGAIHRDRVPLSMYGLTYVPLLLTLLAISSKLAKTTRSRLSAPIQAFAAGLASLLICLALFDTLSALLVCSVMCVLAIVCSRQFSSKYYGHAALALATISLATVIPGLGQLQWWTISTDWTVVLLSGEAVFLLLRNRSRSIHHAAVVGAACLVACWISHSMDNLLRWPTPALFVQPCVLLMGGLGYAVINRQRRVADACWIFAGLIAARVAVASPLSVADILLFVTIGITAAQTVAWAAMAFESSEQEFGNTGIGILRESLDNLSTLLLTSISAVLTLPLLTVIHWPAAIEMGDRMWLEYHGAAAGLMIALLVVLLRNLYRPQPRIVRFARASLSLTAPLVVSGLIYSFGLSISWAATVLVWAFTTAATRWTRWNAKRDYLDAVWPVIITLLSCVDFSFAMRIAAGVVLADPLINGSVRQRTLALPLVAAQIMMATAALTGCQNWAEVTTPMLILAFSTTGVISVVVGEVLSKFKTATNFEKSLQVLANGFATAAVAVGAVSLLDPSTIGMITPIAMLTAAVQCSYQAWVRSRREFIIPAILSLNITLIAFWLSAGWTSIELFTLPIGISVLAVTAWLGDRMPIRVADAARYGAVVLMMGSPLPQTIGGSWIHAAIVLAISVGLILASIGLRVRALMVAGAIGLTIDLIVMVVRTSMGHTTLMWLWGMGIGISVLLLAAYCERYRERLLSRMRILTAELATWD